MKKNQSNAPNVVIRLYRKLTHRHQWKPESGMAFGDFGEVYSVKGYKCPCGKERIVKVEQW